LYASDPFGLAKIGYGSEIRDEMIKTVTHKTLNGLRDVAIEDEWITPVSSWGMDRRWSGLMNRGDRGLHGIDKEQGTCLHENFPDFSCYSRSVQFF
jgi:hypothetical protein